jgi:purine-nucleoside phosphorylase
MFEQIVATADFIKNNGIDSPEVGIVLGTGLGQLVNEIELIVSLSYQDIPNFPVSTVESHTGKLIYGKLSGKLVLVMQGRFHYYEGYSFQEITFPIRVMKLLGIKTLLLSNAAGGVNLNFKKGDLVIIDDHINLLPSNPLIGKNINELGVRFPDMSEPYSPYLIKIIEKVAATSMIKVKKGVYAAVMGPNLETRAEYRFLKTIGADLVGMSTIPEVIVAKHMNLPCAAISVVTDECNPDKLMPVNIEEIIKVAQTADGQLSKIFKEMMKML